MPPHRPLSDETASSALISGGGSSSLGVRYVPISSLIENAKGRAARIFVSAPRSLDAATIFMALVIFAVDVTALSRSESDFREGMELKRLAPSVSEKSLQDDSVFYYATGVGAHCHARRSAVTPCGTCAV